MELECLDDRPASVSGTSRARPRGKIQLLCVGRDLRGGGAERVQLTLLEHLDRRRFDIRLFYLSGQGTLQRLIPPDVEPVYGVPGTQDLKRRVVRLLTTLTGMARQSDVIFAMQEGTPIYLATLAGLLANRPVVGWVHINWSEQLRNTRPWHRWASSLYPLADKLVGVSEGVTKGLVKASPRLRGKTAALPNPLPLRQIQEMSRSGLPAWAERVFAKRTLLAAGRLTPQKGFDVLIPAFAKVIRKGTDLHLLLLGEGPERKKLESMAKQCGVAHRVFMPGFQENPYPFFTHAEAFVLSSRYEGLAMVILEAMALGLPVIATDCPHGPRELTQDGSHGVLVPPEDPVALASAIHTLTGSSAQRASLRTSGIVRADEYDAGRASRLFEDLLTGCAESR